MTGKLKLQGVSSSRVKKPGTRFTKTLVQDLCPWRDTRRSMPQGRRHTREQEDSPGKYTPQKGSSRLTYHNAHEETKRLRIRDSGRVKLTPQELQIIGECEKKL